MFLPDPDFFLIRIPAFRTQNTRKKYDKPTRITVLSIRIHAFFGLQDPDPLVVGMDPDHAPDLDPSIIMKK
jgi:hypothetical protein